MPTWPSPSSKRLGTPKIPAIRFTRGTYFGASRFTYATACQVARPPLTDRTRSPRPQRAFTSRLPAVWSPSLPLDITTTWTGLLLLAGLAPARMAASLAAPEPYVQLSCIRLPPRMFDGWPRPSVRAPAPGTRFPGTCRPTGTEGFVTVGRGHKWYRGTNAWYHIIWRRRTVVTMKIGCLFLC